MENPEAPVADNPVTQEPAAESTATGITAPAVTPGWKSGLSTDLKNSPLLQKFDDSPDGLSKAFESHMNLEKLLGHEKVPIPKDINDVEGWNRFSKAMGIPDKAEGYGLPDAKLPESMKGITIDKGKFAEIMHAHKVHPSAVKGIWNEYQRMNVEAYEKAVAEHTKTVTEAVNRLKGEWGDAYESNVEMGQMVINKFSDDKEMNDWISAVLIQNPYGIKFLAKIGDQFSENKIGEFAMKKFSLAPDEAQGEIDKLTQDLEGPYMNQKGKFSEREHQAAVDRVNSLWQVIARAKQ